ncbi:MAG TPA: hypothetical protein G4O10_09370, partial [Dehalococcoidia bacterium]|nr:hypothetical protein [Dehalococcoidia bacterium]
MIRSKRLLGIIATLAFMTSIATLFVDVDVALAQAPTVTSISPTSGPAAGGTSVTITGTNFVNGATVTIGGASATG